MFGFKRKKNFVGLVSEYLTLLDKGGERSLRPESSLPAPKEEIKRAMIAEAIVFSRGAEANPELVEGLCPCYGLLANFVEDELAEKFERSIQIGKALQRPGLPKHEADGLLEQSDKAGLVPEVPEALLRRNEEYLRLTAEFNKIVAAARR